MAINTQTWLCGPPPANGQYQRYPGRFLFNVKKNYPQFISDDTLHMFAGSCDFGISTDLRPETGANIVGDFHSLPSMVGNNRFENVLADPPYADHWQNQWHGELPKPKHILGVASEVVRPGGLIGILHIIVIPAYQCYGVERIAIHPILSGPNNAMRCFNVFRKV